MKHPANWFNSLAYAFHGIKLLYRERNFRFHLLASAAVCLTASYVGLSATEWAFILSAIALVCITESMNTCIEYVCDYITTDYSSAVKQIKDIAAAAVLLSVIYALIIACIILLPKILYLTYLYL